MFKKGRLKKLKKAVKELNNKFGWSYVDPYADTELSGLMGEEVDQDTDNFLGAVIEDGIHNSGAKDNYKKRKKGWRPKDE